MNGAICAPAKALTLLDVYPVGSVYISTVATSPAVLFGGTWESIGGKFLLSADASYPAGSTGGEARNALTASSIPHIGTGITYVGSGGKIPHSESGQWDDAWLGGGTTTYISNLPPYLSVYMWQRMPDGI